MGDIGCGNSQVLERDGGRMRRVGVVEGELEDGDTDSDVIAMLEFMFGDTEPIEYGPVVAIEIADQVAVLVVDDDAMTARERAVSGNGDVIGRVATKRELGVKREGGAVEWAGDEGDGGRHES
jgi:hypothetical protein